MILRLSRRQSGLALLVPVFCLLFANHSAAEENRPGRPIEFSDPKGSDISTNTLGLKKSLLREFEDDLTKSFHRSLDSHGSLDGVAMPPPQITAPTIQSKRLKEQMEKKKNWVFNAPEDLTSAPTLEELLHLPDYATDPNNKKAGSSIERFYKSLERKRSDGPDNKKENTQTDRDENRERDNSNMLGLRQYELQDDLDSKAEKIVAKDQKQHEGALSRLFDGKSSTFSPGDSGGSQEVNIFGLGTVSPTVEQVEAHKVYMKKFEALIGPTTVANPGIDLRNAGLGELRNAGSELRDSLSGVANLPPVVQSSSDFKALSTPSRLNGFDAGPGVLGLAIPMGIPDLSPKASPWTTPVPLPKAEAPKYNLPTTPPSFQRPF